MYHSRKFALCLAAASLLYLHRPGTAQAAEQDRVAIESFRGPQAQRLQGAVETGLMGRYYLVPDFSVEQMARRRGVALGNPSGMAEVGKALQVRAFLSAQVLQKRNNWHVNVLVRSGDTGAAIGRFVVADRRLDKLESTLAARTSRRVGAMLARASAAESAAIAAEDAADARRGLEPPALSDSAAAGAPDGEATGQPGEVIEISANTRVFNRTFSYAQNVSGLSDYRLEGALAASFGTRFHPLALVSESLAPIGVTAALDYGLGVGSRQAGREERISTDVHGYSLGLAYRVRLGRSAVTPTVGYGVATFNSGQAAGAPNVEYQMVKPGLDARWVATDRFAVMLRGEYLHVLSTGPLGEANRFPRSSVRGVEASLGVGFAVAQEIELEAGGGMRRLGIATNVIPGDRWIAGGAVDQTTWLGLGVAYRPVHRRTR